MKFYISVDELYPYRVPMPADKGVYAKLAAERPEETVELTPTEYDVYLHDMKQFVYWQGRFSGS